MLNAKPYDYFAETCITCDKHEDGIYFLNPLCVDCRDSAGPADVWCSLGGLRVMVAYEPLSVPHWQWTVDDEGWAESRGGMADQTDTREEALCVALLKAAGVLAARHRIIDTSPLIPLWLPFTAAPRALEGYLAFKSALMQYACDGYSYEAAWEKAIEDLNAGRFD